MQVSQNLLLVSRDSILAFCNSICSSFETRESSFKSRVETVNFWAVSTVPSLDLCIPFNPLSPKSDQYQILHVISVLYKTDW